MRGLKRGKEGGVTGGGWRVGSEENIVVFVVVRRISRVSVV